MATRRSARTIAIVVSSVCAALGLVVVTSPPAAADIASISPSSREVNPGGSTSATVTVDSASATCVGARASDGRLAPSFSKTCDDQARWTTTLLVQVPDEPGTYFVDVNEDKSNVGRRFTLVVRAPPPPPTTTVPTTTVPPTTTTRPTTTTAAPTTTTTAPPATTPPPETTTTLAGTTTTTAALTGEEFTPLAALVDAPVPSEGVFFPLLGDGYRSCLPLTEPCRDPSSGFAIIPARTTEITWEPIPEGATSAPRTDLRGIAALSAVGTGPADPRTSNYALAILDLTAPGGQLRTLVRGLDDRGRLGVVTAEQPLLRPIAGGPSVDLGGSTGVAAMPFGRPSIRTASSFSEAAPAIPMFASAEPQVIYAIRPDNGWGLNLDLVPLFESSVPFLVRGIEGPPGIFIARPENLRVPTPDEPEAGTAAGDDDGGGGGTSPVLLLAILVALGVVVTAALAVIRRGRQAPAPEPAPPPRRPGAGPGPGRPRGTSR